MRWLSELSFEWKSGRRGEKSMAVGKTERERERERQTDRQRGRQTETKTERQREKESQLFWSKLFRCAFLDGGWNSPPGGATWPSSEDAEWEQGDEEDAEEKGPISNYLVSSRLGRTNIFAHHCPATFYRHSTGVGKEPGGRGNLVKTGSFSVDKDFSSFNIFSSYTSVRIFLDRGEKDGRMMIYG